MFVELDTRHGGGYKISLEWDRDTDATRVVVADSQTACVLVVHPRRRRRRRVPASVQVRAVITNDRDRGAQRSSDDRRDSAPAALAEVSARAYDPPPAAGVESLAIPLACGAVIGAGAFSF